MANASELGRRDFLRFAGITAVAALVGKETTATAESAEGKKLPWENGKYQTFPGQYVEIRDNRRGKRYPVLQEVDLGTLGPDVDTIFGMDFQGDIPTNALVIHMPDGKVQETRIIGIKRTDLETVQLRAVLRGDRFDVYQISQYGGDKALDEMARLHAANTARKHQKVVYIGDLGRFQKEWGKQEKPLLQRIIRAQRPAREDLGISDPDFVNPRVF